MRPFAMVLAVAALFATSCGKDLDDETLSPERYEQLERLYKDQLALDERSFESEAALERMERSCERLDRSDPLLAAHYTVCVRAIEAGRALVDVDCDDIRACNRAFGAGAISYRRLAGDFRRIDEILDDENVEAACREALSPGRLEEVLLRLANAFETMASTSEDDERGAQALAEFGDIEEDFKRLGSPREMYARFRSACGGS
ncbi:MAG TPA: hypothetical protein VFQ12_01950 [Thermoleophilaceae bacterium]|nr:hypothetical protein [Thermoleophilaceae bacterium]